MIVSTYKLRDNTRSYSLECMDWSVDDIAIDFKGVFGLKVSEAEEGNG